MSNIVRYVRLTKVSAKIMTLNGLIIIVIIIITIIIIKVSWPSFEIHLQYVKAKR